MSSALRDFTALQRNLIVSFANSGQRVTALARELGCSREYIYICLDDPHIRAAIHAQQQKEMVGLAGLSLRRLREILENEDSGAKIWIDAAKVVLGRAGHVEPKAQEASSGEAKPLNELTADELRMRLVDIEGALAERAIEVNAPGAPTLELEQTPDTAETLDIFS